MTAAKVAEIVDRAGETVTLRRITGASTGSPVNTDVIVKASIRLFEPDELVGSIVQGDSLVTIAAAPAVAASWPLPPKKGDKLIRDSATLNVEAGEVRNHKEEAALLILQCRG